MSKMWKAGPEISFQSPDTFHLLVVPTVNEVRAIFGDQEQKTSSGEKGIPSNKKRQDCFLQIKVPLKIEAWSGKH